VCHGGSDDKGLFQITRLKPSAECFYSSGGFLFDPQQLKGAKTSPRQRGGFSITDRLPVKAIN